MSWSGPWQVVQRAGRAAVLAGGARDVAGPRHLHEHGALLQRLAGGPQRERRDPRGAGGGVAQVVVAGDHHPGAALAHERPDGLDRARPAGLDQPLRLDRARRRAQQRGGAGLLGAHPEHVAGVRVRSARLVVQVVAVVPADDEAEVGDGRERRGPGADHDPRAAAQHREEGGVARGRTEVGGEPDRGGRSRGRRPRRRSPRRRGRRRGGRAPPRARHDRRTQRSGRRRRRPAASPRPTRRPAARSTPPAAHRRPRRGRGTPGRRCSRPTAPPRGARAGPRREATASSRWRRAGPGRRVAARRPASRRSGRPRRARPPAPAG